jgi:hypothetical protein
LIVGASGMAMSKAVIFGLLFSQLRFCTNFDKKCIGLCFGWHFSAKLIYPLHRWLGAYGGKWSKDPILHLSCIVKRHLAMWQWGRTACFGNAAPKCSARVSHHVEQTTKDILESRSWPDCTGLFFIHCLLKPWHQLAMNR